MWIWLNELDNAHGPYDTYEDAEKDLLSIAELDWEYSSVDLEDLSTNPRDYEIRFFELIPPSDSSEVQYQWNSSGIIEEARRRVDLGKGKDWNHSMANEIPLVFGPFSTKEEARESQISFLEAHHLSVGNLAFLVTHSPVEEVVTRKGEVPSSLAEFLDLLEKEKA